MRCFLLALAVTLSLAGQVLSVEIYVDNVAGDDLRDALLSVPTGDRGGPARTIAKALRVARTGDRINIANTGRPYYESITLQGGRHSGTPDFPFVVEGNGATISGVQPIPAGAWEHYAENLFRFKPRRLRHRQLFAAGKLLPHHPVDRMSLRLPELQPLEWTVWQGHLYFRTEKSRLPESYLLEASAEITGITLYQVRNVEVRNLIVEGCAVDGINAHDAFGPCLISGVTARANGRSGIGVAGATRVQIDSCILSENGESQLHVDGQTETYVANSKLMEGLAPAWRRVSGQLYFDGIKAAAGVAEQ